MNEREQDLARRLDQDLTRASASQNLESRDGRPTSASQNADLVQLAVRLHAEFAPPEPSAGFVSTGRVRLENRLRGRTASERPTPQRATPRRWALVRRLAFVCLSLAMALIVGSAGIAYAAQDTLPGDSLYGVKLGIEHARLALAIDPDARVQLLTGFADKRIAEAGALISSNREKYLGPALDEYQAEVNKVQMLAGDLPAGDRSAVLAEIQAHLQQHIAVLQSVRDHAPAAAQPALDQAIQGSNHSQDVIEQIQQGNSPSELAPGQLKKATAMPGDNNPHGPPATPPGKSKH